MTLPSHEFFVSPLFGFLAARPEGISTAGAYEGAADAFGLSADARLELLPSGNQPAYHNRIGWAHARLKRAGLSQSEKHGYWRLTASGRALAEKHPKGLPQDEVQRIMKFELDSSASGTPDGDEEPVDEEQAAGLAEQRILSIYQDAGDRAASLEFFAEVIERAHGFGAAVWEVTLQRRRVRLNVGMLMALELSQNALGFGLVPELVSGTLKEFLDEVGEWSSSFKTEPVTRFYRLPVSAFRKEASRLREAFSAFLEVAGRSARQTPYASAHSPAFVDYLERAVGRRLPRPEYVRKGKASDDAEALPDRAVMMDAPRALFKKVDYDLTTLLTYIEMGDIGLPDIQRPFVWSATKVRDLFDSMYRGFPVGYFLFWENSETEGTRAIGTGAKSRRVPSRLIVDGQQRLTSLFAVLRGVRVLDDDFREVALEIAFRPRDGRFEVSDAAIKKDPEFIASISELWSSRKPVRRLINDFLQALGERRPLDAADEDAMSHNIDRLFDLQKYPFTALEILPNVEEEAVADIFVRINSEGVRLNQADFILTMLSVFWDEGRADLERFVRAAKTAPSPGDAASPFNHFIQPSPDQLLRVSVAIGFHRGRLKSVYQVLRGKDLATGVFTAERREAQFLRLRDAQAKVLDLRNWHQFMQSLQGAGFRSSEMISSRTALLYAYAFYLVGKDQCGVDDHALSRLISRWFFASMLTGRYSNSPESIMDADLNRVKELASPDAFAAVLERIIADALTNDFWTITVPNDLANSSARNPTLFAYHAAQVRLDAPVLFSDRKIGDLLDPSIRTLRKPLERHHLFPRAWLERNGVSDLKLINQTANLALLEWPDNTKVSDQAPERYLPALRERFSQSAWDRMASLHALPPDWEKVPFQEFLEQRRKLMANILRRGFDSLGGEESSAEMPADASAEERRVWTLIEQVELALRTRVRSGYVEQWRGGADSQMRKVLGDESWATIERNREKHKRAYPLAPGQGECDVLDYCYLGQLSQLVINGAAWALFQKSFRDKRQHEDLIRSITPVRNDRAHFRHVPERELDRCRIACEDLLALM